MILIDFLFSVRALTMRGLRRMLWRLAVIQIHFVVFILRLCDSDNQPCLSWQCSCSQNQQFLPVQLLLHLTLAERGLRIRLVLQRWAGVCLF